MQLVNVQNFIFEKDEKVLVSIENKELPYYPGVNLIYNKDLVDLLLEEEETLVKYKTLIV